MADNQFLGSDTSASSWFMVYRHLRTLMKELLLNFPSMCKTYTYIIIEKKIDTFILRI